MSALLEESAAVHYARDREHRSFQQMKKDLGDAAIELERGYLAPELEELKKLALIQANRILVALGKPEMIAWPKGWMNVEMGDCDSCGKKGYLRTASVGVTFPMEGDFCQRCRAEEIDESEYRLTTPLQVALDLPCYGTEDFWYVETRTSQQAVMIARTHITFNIFDLSQQRVLTTNQAERFLNDERYGPHQSFGLMLPEDLSLFLDHFAEHLFPELVEA